MHLLEPPYSGWTGGVPMGASGGVATLMDEGLSSDGHVKSGRKGAGGRSVGRTTAGAGS